MRKEKGNCPSFSRADMLYNCNKDVLIQEGQCYWHKSQGKVIVRKILSIKDKHIEYKRVYGPPTKLLNKTGICSFATFRQWLDGSVVENADFSILEGANIQPTFIAENSEGKPLFRCSESRAKFYLRRGFADLINKETIRFNHTGKQTENVLASLYGDTGKLPFFMAVKNDKCVVCGKQFPMTRHHVVPKRHKKKLPDWVKSCISNVLFVCSDCHTKYERQSELEPNEFITDPVEIVKAWRDHFIKTMKPQFIPEGWDIFRIYPEESCLTTNLLPTF